MHKTIEEINQGLLTLNLVLGAKNKKPLRDISDSLQIPERQENV
jgi:hypothetical protein